MGRPNTSERLSGIKLKYLQFHLKQTKNQTNKQFHLKQTNKHPNKQTIPPQTNKQTINQQNFNLSKHCFKAMTAIFVLSIITGIKVSWQLLKVWTQ